MEQVEIVMNTAEHNLARLRARLVGVNRNALKTLPPAHVAQLLARIEQLEQEQEEERDALSPGNPIETQSDD